MKQAAHYQSLEFSRVKALVEALLHSNAHLKILDFGCGNGKYTELFDRAGCSVVGVDINPDYVEALKARGFDVRSPAGLFESGEVFDAIFISHVIEHIAPDDLAELFPKLIKMMKKDGVLIVVTPILGERFYHDFSHVRPYYPQSIRHAFGQHGAPISYGSINAIELIDVYFFRDPFRTRTWRSFYVGKGLSGLVTRLINSAFDVFWNVSGGRIGVLASWLGVYRVK